MNIKKSNNSINNERKWTEQIETALEDNELLQKQFSKDLQLTDKTELSYKLYLYKKNNLDLFHKILSNKYNDLIKPTNKKVLQKIELKAKSDKETLLKEFGLVNESFSSFDESDAWKDIINDYYKIVKKDDLYIILDLTRQQIDSAYKNEDMCLDSFNMLTHNQNYVEDTKMNESLNDYTHLNMFKKFKYTKPMKKEYDMDAILKVITNDVFLSFAYNTILQNLDGDIEKAVKKIYDTYIKDDKDLSKTLGIYEAYNYMKLNEAVNDYSGTIDELLSLYNTYLTKDENMLIFIKNELNTLIDVNKDMLSLNIKTFDNNIKKELYDVFNTLKLPRFIDKITMLDIDYNDIIDFNIDDASELEIELGEIFSISNETAKQILLAASVIEITPFLYIDDETTMTMVFFACLYLIFNGAL